MAAESLYAARMSEWLDRLAPHADDVLKLAVRCQHLERWGELRESYEPGRKGYLLWRRARAQHAAGIAEEILRDSGYGSDDVERISKLVQKKGLLRDADVQMLEDAACLVFLEHYFSAFREKHADDKLIDIVAKTWRKMTPEAHTLALGLEMDDRTRDLVQRALAGD